MPNSRPGSSFNEQGVCLACQNYDKRKDVDWVDRRKKLENLCNSLKRKNGYDCVIAVSGGKDSHFLCNLVVNEFGLNPLLIRIGDNLGITKEGQDNINNLSKEFHSDLIEFTPDLDLYKRETRNCFENLGLFPFIDAIIYNIPVKLANKFGIKFVFFGEDPGYLYGTSQTETPYARESISKNNCPAMSKYMATHSEISSAYPIFTSYFVPWSGYDNYICAKKHGFKELNYDRPGHIENYDSIDLLGWDAVSNLLKYRRLGFGRATDIASRLIREKQLTREQGLKLVKDNDGNIDYDGLRYFLDFAGYSRAEFFKITEKQWNKEIFTEVNGKWTHCEDNPMRNDTEPKSDGHFTRNDV